MPLRKLSLTLLLGSIVLAQADDLPPAKPLKMPVLQYKQLTLPNGLQVLLHEDHRLPLVALDIWYHVGPANEKAGRTGFAHLFEHMMFEGSEHVGEKAHFRYLEGAGATGINGTTDFDRTNYFETLPSNQLELGLWLESDRMGFLLETLDNKKLTNQRDVVRNERRQGEGRPYELGSEEMFHLLFRKGDPYYASIIGSHADIEAARLNDVREFFRSFYTPNNATLVIAGDFEPAKIEPLLKKYFGPIPKGPAVDKSFIAAEPVKKERRATVTDSVQLPRVSIGWLTPKALSEGDSDSDLFIAILGGGESSRLYRKLVYDQQIAQSVSCDNQSLMIVSVATCDVTARPGVKPEDLEKAVTTEIQALRTAGPTQMELDRSRNVVLSRKIEALQRLGGFGGVADTLNYYNQYAGDPGYLPKDLARYQNATTGSVQKAGDAYFASEERAVVYTVPGKKVLDDVPRSPDDTDANVKLTNPYTPEFEQREAWRKESPSAGPAPELHLPVPKTFTASNGMKVYVVEDHALPVLDAAVLTLAGGGDNPLSKPGLASFTARMLTQGTQTRSSTQLANDSALIGARLHSAATVDNTAVSVGVLSNNTDAAIALLQDMIVHPSFSEDEVKRVRTNRLVAILQEADQPTASMLRVGLKALYGNDSPYAFRANGTTESVKAITRDDLEKFWQDHFAPQNSALFLVGDVTDSEARTLVDKYFEAWKVDKTILANHIPKPPPVPTRRIILVDQPGSPQTALAAFGIGLPRNIPNYAAVSVMNNVLGGMFSSRINMNLREKNGFTYGAFSNFTFYRGAGPFFAGALVRTDVTAPAARELVTELSRIRTDPPTDAELKLAREGEMRSLPGQFETVASTSSLMGDLYTYHLPDDYYRQLPAEYQSLTPEVVEQAAKADVHPEQMVLVAVGDRSKIESGLEKLNLGPIEIRDASGALVRTEGSK
jgi:zinc protease